VRDHPTGLPMSEPITPLRRRMIDNGESQVVAGNPKGVLRMLCSGLPQSTSNLSRPEIMMVSKYCKESYSIALQHEAG
jgi:hypothetical protein